MPLPRWTVALLAGPAVLVACGQFGPLYLPGQEPAKSPSAQKLLSAPTSAPSTGRAVPAASSQAAAPLGRGTSATGE